MKKYDIVVIGAGIAGMTAAIYARRSNRTVLVLEGRVQGGQIVNALKVDNWPGDYGVSGAELSQKVFSQMKDLGAEVEYEIVESIKKAGDGFEIKTDEDIYNADAVILAVGAEDKKLGLPSEERLTGKGVSYCATCDGAFYKGKKVAVIGGGNTALYDALYLADLAEKVYLVHRRDEFRGDAAVLDELRKKDNIEYVLGYTPEEILGSEKVTGLRLVPSGMVDAVADVLELDVDGVFVAVGKEPMTSRFTELVELNEKGYVVAGEDCVTSVPGVFVAGDCRTKAIRQLVTASADGAVAAMAASKYIGEMQ